jgi:hypothetical protein
LVREKEGKVVETLPGASHFTVGAHPERGRPWPESTRETFETFETFGRNRFAYLQLTASASRTPDETVDETTDPRLIRRGAGRAREGFARKSNSAQAPPRRVC